MSVGCLAVGDPAVEELFVLASRVGAERVSVIIAPRDPRGGSLLPVPPGLPAWTNDLYRTIENELRSFPAACAPRDDRDRDGGA